MKAVLKIACIVMLLLSLISISWASDRYTASYDSRDYVHRSLYGSDINSSTSQSNRYTASYDSKDYVNRSSSGSDRDSSTSPSLRHSSSYATLDYVYSTFSGSGRVSGSDRVSGGTVNFIV